MLFIPLLCTYASIYDLDSKTIFYECAFYSFYALYTIGSYIAVFFHSISLLLTLGIEAYWDRLGCKHLIPNACLLHLYSERMNDLIFKI